MSKQYPSIKNRFLPALFLISLTLTLSISDVTLLTQKIEFGTVVKAQNQNPSQLVEKGVEYYQQGEFRKAIEQWKIALQIYRKNQQLDKQAIVLGNLAIANQKVGDIEQSVKQWEEVVSLHRQLKNHLETGRALTELAQAYSSLGQPKKAIEFLCGVEEEEIEEKKIGEKSSCFRESALEIAKSQEDEQGKVAALGSLGEAYRQLAQYELAIKYLEDAKEISNANNNFLIENSLGNVYLSQAQLWILRAESAQINREDKYDEFINEAKLSYQNAEKSFLNSLQIATNKNDESVQMRAIMNLIQIYFRSKRFNLFDQNKLNQSIEEALVILDKLPDSPQKVYAAIDLANLPGENINTLPLTQCSITEQSNRKLSSREVKKLFNKAVKIANKIQNLRSQSFALGAKGHYYECQGNYDRALDFTRQALIIADQNLQAKDSVYLWEWQTGRLLQKKGNQLKAIDAYERAFQTLEKIRGDILTANRDLQLDFRDVIQPIYRKLAELKLEQIDEKISFQQKGNKQVKENNDRLTEARTIIDSLRLAELQNYFGNECILAAIRPQQVDELLGDDTAVFSSIILENEAVILLNLPNQESSTQESYFEWIKQENGQNITTQELNRLIKEFRQSLVNAPKEFVYDTTQAAKLYKMLIAPFEKYINPEKIKTFVFVQDGLFRSIPMAALYNSNQNKYLIEKYAIATTPSLRLTAPKKLNTENSRALISGVNQSADIDGQKFSALSNVNREIKSLQKIFPNTEPLLNQNFTLSNLRQRLNKNIYPVIHIATHAQFGIIPEDTFLVAGNNQKLTINELEKVLREFSGGINSIELLSLTACETALGDQRATLGLAGIALQVGVRSALASLWAVRDKSTPILVEEFYQNLRAGKSKAEALQQAQIKLLQAKELDDVNDQYDNPGYWAPFIMIGNWL